MLSLVLVAVLMAAIFAGCGSKQTPAAEAEIKQEEVKKERREVTGAIMQSRYCSGLEQMIQKLEEEENIYLDMQVVPDDQYNNMLKMQLNSGIAPDLLDFNCPHIYGFLGNPENYMEDLSAEPWAERLLSKDLFSYEGKVYALPFYNIQGLQCIIYNKDALEKAGVEKLPTTKEEFNAVCEQIKAAGIIPLLMPADSWCSQIWMSSGFAQVMGSVEAAEEFADQLFTNQAKLTDHPELAAVIDDFVGNVTAGYVNDDFLTVPHTECIQRLATGEAAMYYHNGVAITNKILSDYPNANIGLMIYPADFNPQGLLSVSAYSASFFVNKDGEHVETAKEVLRLFSTPEYCNLYYTDGNGGFPALEGVSGGEIHDVIYNFYTEKLEAGKLVSEMNIHFIPVESLESGTLWTYYQEAAQGKMTGAEVLERFQVDIEKYMKEQKAPGF